MYAGTSWEGTVWTRPGAPRLRSALVIVQLLAIMVPLFAMLAVVAFAAAPAKAHPGIVSCRVQANKPYNGGSGYINAYGAAHCLQRGFRHTLEVRIWENINNWPDDPVGRDFRTSTRKDFGTTASGKSNGCGEYYNITKLPDHNTKRSYPYYRC